MTIKPLLRRALLLAALSTAAFGAHADTLDKLRDCLLRLEPRVELDEEIIRRAALPLERMLAVR